VFFAKIFALFACKNNYFGTQHFYRKTVFLAIKLVPRT
jgi:hypothetical protein